MRITINGKTYYEKAAGYQDIRTREKLKHNSIFNIGSITKPFTSVAILQLQEKQLLSINENVKKYLPEFPFDSVTIKHLLSHTSGLIRDFNFLEEVDLKKRLNNDSIISLLKKYKVALIYPPGSEFGYSNTGYDLLALVVERISGQTFADYVHDHIFVPAAMNRSFIPKDKELMKWAPKKVSKREIMTAHMYDNITSCEVITIDSLKSIPLHDHFFVGSSNIYSCVYDLEKFDAALRNNVILSSSSQKLAYTPFVLNNGDTAKDMQAPIPSYCGLGWDISIDTSRGKVLWYKGRSFGSRSVYIRVPSNKLTVTFTDNFDYTACDLKAISCLKTIAHQPYRNPLLISLAQKFGCAVDSKGFEYGKREFERLKATERKNHYISEDEMIDVGYRLGEKQKFKDAVLVLNFCKELFPKSAALFIIYGDLSFKMHMPDSALKHYTQAVSLFGSNDAEKESLLNSIGYQFMVSGRLNDAEELLKLNTLLFPKSCNTYDSYASVLAKNQKMDLAILNEEKAVDIAKESNDSLLPTLQENLKNLRAKRSNR